MRKVLFVDMCRLSEEGDHLGVNWKQLRLEIGGYANTTANAMTLFLNERFALAVVLIQGADTEGMALCEQIRRTSSMPIVLVGGRMDFQLARRAMQHQVSDYLPAPFTIHDLEASLRSVKAQLDESDCFEEPIPDSPEDDYNADSTRRANANVINKVKEYVEEALHRNITLKQISNVMHFNSSYLGQKFKCHVNMTFNEYVLQQRMEKAKKLLEHTNMKIYEIANKVGYTEIDWFYKKFKSYTGVSANEYRRLYTITA